MPIRAVVLFSVGAAFGGFRIAVRPGILGLDDPDAFQALERAIHHVQSQLSPQPPSTWPEIAARAARPEIDGRAVNIDLTADAGDDHEGEVIVRACLPFQIWPLGGWVVYEAWDRSRDGSWSAFSAEKLAEIW